VSENQYAPLVDLSPQIIGDPVVEMLARHVSEARGFNPDSVINADRKIYGWMVNADVVSLVLAVVRRAIPDLDERIDLSVRPPQR